MSKNVDVSILPTRIDPKHFLKALHNQNVAFGHCENVITICNFTLLFQGKTKMSKNQFEQATLSF